MKCSHRSVISFKKINNAILILDHKNLIETVHHLATWEQNEGSFKGVVNKMLLKELLQSS